MKRTDTVEITIIATDVFVFKYNIPTIITATVTKKSTKKLPYAMKINTSQERIT